MSRIGKKPVVLPAGVKVQVAADKVTISGAKHSLVVPVREEVKVTFDEAGKQLGVTIADGHADNPAAAAYWGTTRALLQNAVEGVNKGYEKVMEVVGVGWTAALQGKNIKLTVGFANPIVMPIPAGLDVTVDKQFVTIKGPDKKAVGQFAADMRARRKPEPYNGKGIKYKEETIKRKQGKQFGA
jgi:large subunit ribosomal protein L6